MVDQIINQPELPKNNTIAICKTCTKERKIYSSGQCKSCYNRIHRDQLKQKECITRWRNKHPDYYKIRYLNKKQVKNEIIREESIV